MTTYRPKLDLRETQRAICDVKELFQRKLAHALNLTRVSAPLFVRSGTGINDDLNGIERPVSFDVKALGDRAEIVQSLAKWKRLALAEYGFGVGEGIYTDMNAVRPDETLDELHSIYVDQWDWEAVIPPEERTLACLEDAVGRIYGAIRATGLAIAGKYPACACPLPEHITILHTEKLARLYPGLDRPAREDRICEEHGAVFLAGIGAPLADGLPYDGRAPDYDDWSTETELGPGLNGDILVWSPVLGRAMELSSMGIRVDARALRVQLEASGSAKRADLPFHRRLLEGRLPETMGGGIGQSRLCMFYLHKRHIGEVQCGLWPEEVRDRLAGQGVNLL